MNVSRQVSRLLRAAVSTETRAHFHPSSFDAIPHKVEVLYCRGWGYGRRFEFLRLQLFDAFDPSLFGGKQIVRVEGKEDTTNSGAFEVYVEGKLVHSKLKGDGFIDNEGKLDNLVAAIEELGIDWEVARK